VATESFVAPIELIAFTAFFYLITPLAFLGKEVTRAGSSADC